jgi:hypothetical protein
MKGGAAMDKATLTRDLLVFLQPFLPYLLKAGEKAVEEAGKKLGADAWEWAKTLWGKLRPKVEAKPSIREAVEDVVAAPDDAGAQAALRQQLRKLLTDDEVLAREIAQLWVEANANGVTIIADGKRSIAAQNIQGSIITTGNQNVVQG